MYYSVMTQENLVNCMIATKKAKKKISETVHGAEREHIKFNFHSLQYNR